MPTEAREGTDSPRTGVVMSGCKLPDLCAKNQTQVLWKGRKHSNLLS